MFSKVGKVENVETWKLFKWQNFWSHTNIKSAIQTLNIKFVLSGQVFKDSYLKPAFHILRYTQIEESSVFWGRFAKLKILLKKILDISGLWVSKKFMKHIKPLIFPQMFKNCFNGSSANQVSLIWVLCLIGWITLKQKHHWMNER